jgi:hypothetical protein
LAPWRIHTAPTATNTTPSTANVQRIPLDSTPLA